jgi:molecular chaperone GrpE
MSEEEETVTPEGELEKLQEELEQQQDKYVRLLAELDNSRKRFARDREESIKHAIADTVIGFLSPLDHLEKALHHANNAPDEVKNWAIGFQMILHQFKEALAEQDIVAFDAVGEPFDPHHHEAVEMIESDEHPPGTVVAEEVRGYRMGNRTIRPARVKVTKQTEEKEDDSEEG